MLHGSFHCRTAVRLHPSSYCGVVVVVVVVVGSSEGGSLMRPPPADAAVEALSGLLLPHSLKPSTIH